MTRGTVNIEHIEFIHLLSTPICVEDENGFLILANDAYLRLMRSDRDTMIGTKAGLSSEFFCSIRSEVNRLGEKSYTEGDQILSKLKNQDGQECMVLATGRNVYDESGTRFILWSLCDISLFVSYEKELEEKQRDLRRQQTQLKELATIDPLTGTSNRRCLYDKAKELVTYAEIGGLDIGVLMIDLDHFKKLNDSYGHAAGDEVLVSFAKLVRKCIRSSDVFARLGGEEFAILLPDANETATRKIASRIIELTEKTPIAFDGQEIRCTTSIGCAMWAPHEAKIDMTLNRADKQLYQAKENGRNQLKFDTTTLSDGKAA